VLERESGLVSVEEGFFIPEVVNVIAESAAMFWSVCNVVCYGFSKSG
jgi:hypothetical protein